MKFQHSVTNLPFTIINIRNGHNLLFCHFFKQKFRKKKCSITKIFLANNKIKKKKNSNKTYKKYVCLFCYFYKLIKFNAIYYFAQSYNAIIVGVCFKIFL